MISYVQILILGLWLGMTVLVDFIAIPIVFRTLTDVFQAGLIGMQVFEKLNFVEVFLGLAFMVSCFYLKKTLKLVKFFAIILSFLAGFYFFFLTPKITKLSLQMMELTHQAGAGLQQVAQDHDFYHHLYVKLDGVKILMLLFCLFLLFYQKKKEKL